MLVDLNYEKDVEVDVKKIETIADLKKLLEMIDEYNSIVQKIVDGKIEATGAWIGHLAYLEYKMINNCGCGYRRVKRPTDVEGVEFIDGVIPYSVPRELLNVEM